MLKSIAFKSIFKNELNEFIQYKHSIGYKYEKEIPIIKYIDKVLFDINLKSKCITKETFMKLTKRISSNEAVHARKYSIVKEFCIYLISNNYKNIYYEDKKFHIINNYVPIIFNKDEITKLFETCDTLTKKHLNYKFYRLYYGYAIIIRLLYSCGLRASEALKIKFDDINFTESTIKIINSKGNVSRIIVMSDSMKICLQRYIYNFNINDGLIFVSSKEKAIETAYLWKYYKKVLRLSNLNVNSHIHDLRHMFANEAFNKMLEKGYDENVVIVYLYKFMGHTKVSDTEYYLHFTDYNKKKMIAYNQTFSKQLYEGVDLTNE